MLRRTRGRQYRCMNGTEELGIRDIAEIAVGYYYEAAEGLLDLIREGNPEGAWRQFLESIGGFDGGYILYVLRRCIIDPRLYPPAEVNRLRETLSQDQLEELLTRNIHEVACTFHAVVELWNNGYTRYEHPKFGTAADRIIDHHCFIGHSID